MEGDLNFFSYFVTHFASQLWRTAIRRVCLIRTPVIIDGLFLFSQTNEVALYLEHRKVFNLGGKKLMDGFNFLSFSLVAQGVKDLIWTDFQQINVCNP